MQVDEDIADLGVLTAGTAIAITMERFGTSKSYPFFGLLRVDDAQQPTWQRYSAIGMDGAAIGRQFVIPETGHYLVTAEDGRVVSWMYYGDGRIPYADDCCEGGPDYTYSLTASSSSLGVTEPTLGLGTDRTDAVDAQVLRVYPVVMTAAIPYTIGMQTVDSRRLDPVLLLIDPTTRAVLAENDDIDNSNGNYNSQIVWTPSADITLWIVADYVTAALDEGPPQYHLTVN